jgi:hypothetical protein
MRELFGTCGDVLEIEFAAERASRGPSAAYVTMATSVGADRALQALHGRLHGDRTLMISRLSGEGASAAPAAGPAARGSAAKETRAAVVMTQQYRDRLGLTYELSCSGKLLTLRFVLPPDDTHEWRIEARVLPGASSPVTAGAMTREQAFRALVGACTDAPTTAEEWQLDWEGVAAALRAVRGL